jgi:hypothetical protein
LPERAAQNARARDFGGPQLLISGLICHPRATKLYKVSIWYSSALALCVFDLKTIAKLSYFVIFARAGGSKFSRPGFRGAPSANVRIIMLSTRYFII